MKELAAFAITTGLALALIAFIGSKRKKASRYERSAYGSSDWQKLDRGIDPTTDTDQ